LDIHLLKPARAWAQLATDFALGCEQVLAGDDGRGEWTTYKYRTAHPILRWLPTKLAEWIGDNYGPDLGIAPRGNVDGWTVGELNTILENNLVPGAKGHLRTFGCIEWESAVFNGRPKARCYPFDLPKHRFRGKKLQVLHNSYMNSYHNSCMNSGLCLLGRPSSLQSQRPRDL
jgi:hypothetical protein